MGLITVGPQCDAAVPKGVAHSRDIAESPAVLLRSRPWYSAYMAALFEADRRKLGERIRFAEQMILTRERELVRGDNDSVELRSLNNALHALHALQSCLGV